MSTYPQLFKMKRLNRKFTPDEDAKLKKLVGNFGESSWEDVAAFMSGRNPRQCRDRWFCYLSPSINNSPWTEEEDDRIIRLQPIYNGKWVKMSKKFKGRTDVQIKNRWNILKKRVAEKPKTIKDQKILNEEAPVTVAQAQEVTVFPNIFDQLSQIFDNYQEDMDFLFGFSA